MQQEIFITDTYTPFVELLIGQKVFLVCDGAYDYLRVKEELDKLPNIVKFSDFAPNPDYESVKKAVELYKAESCGVIIAVGGGSAMDLAKCVKAYASMPVDREYLEQEIKGNDIRLIAMPTTAGTGSEATRYAVIYYEGSKQSITHESLIPGTVVFDSSALKTLPEYQRKATMMDALCHAIESFWSVNSTDESKEYSKQAISLILEKMDAYLNNEDEGNRNMLKAANIAGKAINITQTTAGHAMCYKLTSLYGIAHGHAAALCVNALLPYMVEHSDDCIDIRGKAYLEFIFSEIAETMRCNTIEDLCTRFSGIIETLGLAAPKAGESDYEILKNSVNPTRLKNHPIQLTTDTIKMLYHQILR